MFPTIFIPQELYNMSPWDVYDELPGGLRVSKHPLYVQLLAGDRKNWPSFISSPDEIVKRNLIELERAYSDKNIHRYVFLHERAFRFPALLDAKNIVGSNDAEWFEVAGDVWVDSERPGINAHAWRSEVFASRSPNLYMTMDNTEFEQFRKLKDPITIYRGADSKIHARNGLSWTTSREKAIWFAKRFSTGKQPILATATVKRIKIAALFLRRGEKEIVLADPPRGVTFEYV